jgi:hypothetical protein
MGNAGFRREWDVSFFVWTVWGCWLIADLWLVYALGSRNPIHDDWALVPALTDPEAVSLSWLWSQHNEHRIPLPRLIILTLLRVSGNDFRAGMLFNVVLLSALAFGAIRTAQVLRGGPAYTDALFPTVLLHWGNFHNLLWCFQVGFVVPVALAGVILLLIAAGQFTSHRAVAIGGCLLLLPLCGAPGLVFALPLALWFGYWGLTQWRVDRSSSLLQLSTASWVCLITGFYFVGFQSETQHADPATTARATLQFLANCVGSVAPTLWPLASVPLAGMMGGCVALLARACRQPGERKRAFGLLAFSAGFLGLAIGLGWGRSSCIFSARYVTLAALSLYLFVFVALIYAPPSVARLGQMALFVAACLVVWPNSRSGFGYATEQYAMLNEFETQILAGVPLPELAQRYSRLENHGHPDRARFSKCLRAAKEGQIGVFRHVVVPYDPCENVRDPARGHE